MSSKASSKSKDSKRKSSSKKGEKVKGKRAKKDKDAPKKSMSAYILYSNDVRDKVRQTNPGIAFGEVAKKISEQWKNITASEKKKFEDKAAKDKQRYETEMEAYRAAGGGSSKSKSSKKSKKVESESDNNGSDDSDEEGSDE